MSICSRPALSDRVRGIDSSESANASTASCSLPPIFGARSRILFANSISIAPPPATILFFFTTSMITERASLSALSASSTSLSRPALIRMLTDLGSFASSMKTILSSPTFRSSTRPANPRSALRMCSRLVIIRAPVALAFLFHQLNILDISRESIASFLNDMVNRVDSNIRKVFRRSSKGLPAHRGHSDLPKSLSVFQIYGFPELVQNLTRLLSGLFETSVNHSRMQTLVQQELGPF